MKKYIVILLSCLIPLFATAGSCYGNWLGCYNSAESNYASDVSYCGGRGLDTKSSACYRYASFDFSKSVERCSDSYYYCVIEF
jgi:hypothetical protein